MDLGVSSQLLTPSFSCFQDREREGDAADESAGTFPGGAVAAAPALPSAVDPKAGPVWPLPLHRPDLHRWEPAL